MLKDLFHYHDQANRLFIPLLVQSNAPAEALRLFSHVINAHGLWLDRMQGRPPRFEVWQVHPAETFEALHEQLMQETEPLLAGADLEATFAYQNSRGQHFENQVQQMLFHLINHSTYHRGQIALALRQAGITPPATDYIVLRRSERN